MGESEIGEG